MESEEFTIAKDISYTKQVWVSKCLDKNSFCVVTCEPYLTEIFCSRSSLWEGLRDRVVARNPRCLICHKNKNLQVHHIKPFHLYPELELTDSNLRVLCQTCHLTWGHLGDWKSFNLDLDKDVQRILTRPYSRI